MKFFSKLFRNKTLFYPGHLTKISIPKIETNYKDILEDLDVDFVTIEDQGLCCGMPAKQAGYKGEYERLQEVNRQILLANKIGKVITNSPANYLAFKDLGDDFEVEHVLQTIYNNIDKLERCYSGEEITYYDPGVLSRKANIYEEPRAILRKLGLKVAELPESKKNSRCCGIGFQPNNKRLADEAARIILSQVKTEKLVTSCPACYLHFKRNAPSNIQVLEFSEVFK